MRDWMNRRRLNLLAMPLACVLLSGCGSDEDMQGLISEATARLEAIPSGRGTIPQQKAASAVYREVREILRPVLDGGLDAEKAAASLIIGETEFAEAATKVREATKEQRGALAGLMKVEATLNVWQVAETRRSVAASFDVGDERQKLRSEIAELDGAIASERQVLEGLKGTLDDINAQIHELDTKANGERAEAAKLEIQADSADPTEALPLISQAQKHSRQADAYVMQAEKLRGEVERLAPQIDRQELRISGDQSAKQVRSEDLDGLSESEQFHATQASEATIEADKIRDDLVQMLFGNDGIEGVFSGPLQQALEDAESALAQAQRSARNGSNLRQQSRLLVGRIAQTHGQVLLNQAQEITRFRATLRRLAAIDAIAGGEPRIASRLSEMHQGEIDAYNAAAEAIQEASDAFGGAGMGGEARDLLDRLQTELAESRQAAQDRVADLGGESSGG